MADLHHLGSDGRRRISELLERFDLVERRGQAGVDLLRRHAPTARSRDDAGRIAEGDLPRRADNRPGPAQSPHHVGEHPRPGLASGVTIFLTTQYLDEADHLADRIAVLDHGGSSPREPGRVSRRRIPGGHVELRFTSGDAVPPRRSASSRTSPTGGCAQPPGAERRQRRRATAPARAGSTTRTSTSTNFSIHTPDLDDVFFAVTGRDPARRSPSHERLRLTVTDSRTMMHRNLRRLVRSPSMTVLLVGMPMRVPPALRLCLRRTTRRRARLDARGRPRRSPRLPQLRHARRSCS